MERGRAGQGEHPGGCAKLDRHRAMDCRGLRAGARGRLVGVLQIGDLGVHRGRDPAPDVVFIFWQGAGWHVQAHLPQLIPLMMATRPRADRRSSRCGCGCPDLALGGLCVQRLPEGLVSRHGVARPFSCQSAAVAGGRRNGVWAGEWSAISRAGRAVTGVGQPLAVLLALAGSGAFAVGTVVQQGVAARLPSQRAFDPAVLVRLACQPIWLASMAAVIVGFVLQAAALGLGRLVVIEPVLATGLLFALALATRRDHRPLSRGEWVAALTVVAGLAVFLAAGQPAGGRRTASAAVLGLAVAAAAGLIGLCAMLAGRFPASRRALLLGVGAGAAAGATDALTKSVAVLAAGHLLALFADARLYLLIMAGLLTYTIQQNGYRAAGLAAFLPAFAVIEPVSGSLLGLIIYHERLSDRPGQIAVELAACAAATWGIARLAGPGIANVAQRAAWPTQPTRPGPAGPVGQPDPVGQSPNRAGRRNGGPISDIDAGGER
jgi:hypothetical protein